MNTNRSFETAKDLFEDLYECARSDDETVRRVAS